MSTHPATLQACPWCRQQPALEQDFDEPWHVCCTTQTCPVKPISHGYRSGREAALAWNCCGRPDVMPEPVS